MADYLYEDERGDIIITPLVTQRGEGWKHAGEWNAGTYYLQKDVPCGRLTRNFHDPRGLTYETEEVAIRVTVQLAEERIRRGYGALFED